MRARTTLVPITVITILAIATPAQGSHLDGQLATRETDPPPVVNCRTITLAPNVDLSGCDLSGADLSGANLSYADLTDADLSNANLSDAILLGATAPGVDLSAATIADATLIDADLSGADLSGASIRRSTLTSADLSDADLGGARLRSTILTGADLSGADLHGATLDGVDLTNADLSASDLTGVDLTETTLAGTRFTQADLAGATLTRMDLSGLSFAGANLAGADLTRTRLVRTDLNGVDLTDADLSKADLSHALQSGITWHNTRCPDGFVTTALPCPMSTSNEAGFIRVGAIDYTFHYRPLLFNQDIDYSTTPVELFYAYQPVDAPGADAADAPLFVMLNGGPGAATTANLFANNTAQFTMNLDTIPAGAPGFDVNPDSWTSMANLLYIDPPQTGFSYSVSTPAATNFVERFKDYFLRGNFNSFIDADQVLRAVLTFLRDHPDLQDNQIVLVGESYGGTRVTTMLNMLLFNGNYGKAGPSFFRDPGLVQVIRQHFADIGMTQDLTPEVVARQFGRQILIQPQLTSYQGPAQSDLYWPSRASLHSPIDDVATASGNPGGFTRDPERCKTKIYGVTVFTLDPGACAVMVYVPAFGRDRYNWQKPADWSDLQDAAAATQLSELGKLNTMLGFDVSRIPEFPADARRDLAYGILLGKPWQLNDAGVPQFAGIDEDALIADLGDDVPQVEPSSAGYLYPGILQRLALVDAQLAAAQDQDSLVSHFGKLGDADRYYLSWNDEVYLAYAANVFAPEYRRLPISADRDPTYGEMFLQNVKYVQTFLTDASYDLVINSEALPLALDRHTDTVRAVERQPAAGEGTGRFVITYKNGTQVRLYYPHYGQSGHAVAASEPAKLRSDIARWLTCSATASCFVS